MSRHCFRLSTLAPQDQGPCGSRTAVTSQNFPALEGMSLYKLSIEPGCFREPHWHPNADEMGYCTKGKVLVTVFSSGNRHDVFTISAGQMYLAPSGSFHAIENIGTEAAEIVAAFNHASPEDFGLSGSTGCFKPEVIGNTWGLEASEVSMVTQTPKDILYGRSDGAIEVPATADYPNPFKFPVEAMPPLIANEYGSARIARADLWPALRSQSMFSLRIEGTGMREPHWHPETAEMGYCLAGRSRMTIKLPGDGPESIDTYEFGPGDMYFIPKAYPHHIENLGSDELRFLVFFDRSIGMDIGYTGGIAAFPRRVVAPTLGTTAAALPAYPEYPADLLIVGKSNPVGL